MQHLRDVQDKRKILRYIFGVLVRRELRVVCRPPCLNILSVMVDFKGVIKKRHFQKPLSSGRVS